MEAKEADTEEPEAEEEAEEAEEVEEEAEAEAEAEKEAEGEEKGGRRRMTTYREKKITIFCFLNSLLSRLPFRFTLRG